MGEPKPPGISEAKTPDATPREGDLLLQDLLTYDNPNFSQYQKLIRQAKEEQEASGFAQVSGFRNNGADYQWLTGIILSKESPAKEVLEFLKDKLKGQILIDIASGGSMKYLSKQVNVKTHVEVNLYTGERPDPYSDVLNPISVPDDFPVKVIGVTADALDFVSRIRGGSVNFIVNGLDSNIIPVTEYHEALAEEMVRATLNGGVILGLNSSSLDFVKENPQIEIVKISGLVGGRFGYQLLRKAK